MIYAPFFLSSAFMADQRHHMNPPKTRPSITTMVSFHIFKSPLVLGLELILHGVCQPVIENEEYRRCNSPLDEHGARSIGVL